MRSSPSTAAKSCRNRMCRQGGKYAVWVDLFHGDRKIGASRKLWGKEEEFKLGSRKQLFHARNFCGGGSPEGAEVPTCTLFSPLWALFGTFLSQQKVTSSPPQRRREQRIKSRLVLKSNMGEMLRKAHQSHSKFPRNTAWQRVQRRLSQTQVTILSGFANAASSSASGYSKHNRS